MYKNDKLRVEASSLSIELCSTLVNRCSNIYKLLGNHFQKDFYLWTLIFELDNLGYKYQLCGNKSGLELYPDTIKINSAASGPEIYLVVHAKSDWNDWELREDDSTNTFSKTAHCLLVNFGYHEFKYKLV
jgi:hypothetical protein